MRTLADIEHRMRKASPGTYAMLENKLAWAPGSIDTILAGGEPKKADQTAPPHPQPARAHLEQRCAVSRLHRGVTARATAAHHRPRPRRHETWDDWDNGLDAQGD